MQKIKFILLSDLHLEKIDHAQLVDKVADTINFKIGEILDEGFEPIVLIPGDVSNGLNCNNFFKQIKSKIIFTPGNHEYWGYDYFTINESFNSDLPTNVTYLNNDFTIIDNVLVIGTTLWTDTGFDLNPDISIDCAARMNDMHNILANDWYTQDNINNLLVTYKTNNVSSKVDGQLWNFLVEYQENRKSWLYLQDISEVLRMIHLSHSFSLVLFDGEDSSSGDQFLQKIKDKINYLAPNLNWQDFVNNLKNVANSYSLPFEDNYQYVDRVSERSMIFDKLKTYPEVYLKNIIVMTHHLPFYEEFLVGHNEQDGRFKLKNHVDPENFLISHGLEYPSKRYIAKALRGEVPRFNDLTHIVNYSNNGSVKCPAFLMNNVKLWVHGHEHYFKYKDFVKGIYFATNPCGLYMKEIVKDRNPFDSYTPEVKSKIANKLLMSIPTFEEISDIRDTVLFNVLKNVNWKSLKEQLSKLSQISHKILVCSADIVNSSTLENKRKSQTDLNEKLHYLVFCYTAIRKSFIDLVFEIEVAVNARLNKNFTFQQYGTNKSVPSIELFQYLFGYDCPTEIEVANSALSICKKSFDTIALIKFSEKHTYNIQQILNNQSATIIDIKSKIPSQEDIKLKLKVSWDDFHEKRFTSL